MNPKHFMWMKYYSKIFNLQETHKKRHVVNVEQFLV